MYKVLIADDEKNIRLGIQAMIQREFGDKFEIFLASDGNEALKLAEETHIDILITDIKMPKMDGIELIKALNEKEKTPALLILSGYDDFAYAKEAIKSKVKDYLLKPVNRNELFKSINLIIEDLESSQRMTYQHIEEYRSSQLNYILLNPILQRGYIENVFRKMQIGFLDEGYFVGLIDPGPNFKGDDFTNLINDFIARKELRDKTLCFLDREERTVVLTTGTETFFHLKESLSRDRHIDFSIGVSEKAENIYELKSNYEQAVSAQKYHFLFPGSKIIFYEKVKGKEMPDSIPVELIKKISNMLGTDREKEIKTLLFELLDFSKITSYAIGYLEALNKEINTIIFENFSSKIGEEPGETFKFFEKVKDIYKFENFHEYFHAVEDLLWRLHEYSKQLKSLYSEQKYMDKALDYIRENYHKDLNLAVVSNYISLNYSYFSHMFKEFTGKNFVDYLKMIRIQEAKRLLKETDNKVFEISEMVGYKNSKQFARVFREIEGISPKEYREQK